MTSDPTQVHVAFGVPASAVTYIDEEGDAISLDSEGEREHTVHVLYVLHYILR